jgi:hypothetical protein
MTTSRFTFLFLACFSWSFPLSSHAQSVLEDRMAKAGTDWLIGEWEGKDENGQTLQQTFSWDLDKHVVNSQTKNPRWEIKGTTGWNPETGHAIYVGFSNRGGALKGTWGERDGSPILTLKAMDQEGRSWSGAVVYKKKDASTMEVQIFGLNDDGSVKDTAQSTLTYKKK